ETGRAPSGLLFVLAARVDEFDSSFLSQKGGSRFPGQGFRASYSEETRHLSTRIAGMRYTSNSDPAPITWILALPLCREAMPNPSHARIVVDAAYYRVTFAWDKT
ncbi:hypothetical protein K0M31_000947, partial [Melipona bicolor]